MRHWIESPFYFRLAEKKTAIHGQKKRRLGMSWPSKRPTHPKRGADRYGLLSKSRSLLPAALKVRKEPSASPHLEAGHLPGCKPERLSATVPCVPLRYALPDATCERQRKEGQRVSCLEHRYAADFLVRGRTDLRFEYSAAGRGLLDFAGSA